MRIKVISGLVKPEVQALILISIILKFSALIVETFESSNLDYLI